MHLLRLIIPKISMRSIITLFLISAVLTVYSPPVALQMAYLSAISYESVINIQAWNCKLCQTYKINTPKNFFNLSSGVRGFTGYSSSLSAIVVSFKGADNINTFIQDLKIARDLYERCEGCEVSRSFSELFLTVKATILSQVESLHRIYRNAGIYVTGHGLGGAFAILAAVEFKNIYQITDAVYVFGTTRVGNQAFASYYTKTVPETYRVINNADIVPHLPLSSAGFVHSSHEIWYQSGMQAYKQCEGGSSGCSNSLPANSLNVNDNSINTYITLKPSNSLTYTQ